MIVISTSVLFMTSNVTSCWYWSGPQLYIPMTSGPSRAGGGCVQGSGAFRSRVRAVAKAGRLGWVQQVSDRPDAVAETDTQFYGVGAFRLAASAVTSITEG